MKFSRHLKSLFPRRQRNRSRTGPARGSARRRLRVCMVAYTFYEWDNRVKRYAEALAGRGDEVDVIALKHDDEPGRERVNGVNVYRIQKRRINERNRFSYLCRLSVFLVNSARCLLIRHLRRPYDVIHVHSVPDFEVFAAFLPKCLGAKVILDIHDMGPELYMSKFHCNGGSALFRSMIQLERASSSFADHVIIANDLWKETLLARSVNERKCSVFLNYPDPAIFHPRPRPVGRDNHECRLLYPGTLNWHQGLDVAVRAFARIRQAAGQAHFYIYGQGPEKSRLEILIRQLNLEDRVHILPMQPIESIAEIMAAADIGVVPKRRDSFGNEAFSTKIFEFMSLGVPVVAADTRIDTHYFSDDTIQFFRSGDEQDLADKLLDLIRNRRKRNRLARQAQQFVQQYSWQWHRDRYLALIDRLSGRAAGDSDDPAAPAATGPVKPAASRRPERPADPAP